MDLLSGNIGGVNFQEMKRGHFYKFSYPNMQSTMQEPMVLNPVIVFSALDRNRRIHGLDLRILRNSEIFLEDYEKFYMKDGKIKEMYTPEHPHAFSFRILKALFLRNPDVENAWRIYNPLHMKAIKDINIGETQQEMRNFHKVRLNNMGVI
jgi:hypothetical protein